MFALIFARTRSGPHLSSTLKAAESVNVRDRKKLLGGGCRARAVSACVLQTAAERVREREAFLRFVLARSSPALYRTVYAGYFIARAPERPDALLGEHPILILKP